MPIVTFDSFRHNNDDDDDDAKKKGNEYFAGGLNAQGGGSGMAVVGGPKGEKSNQKLVVLYKNGYRVDSSEFCTKDDTEEHKAFYDSLLEGFVPRELENEVRQHNLKVVVDDKRQSDYVAPPPRFGHISNMLGSTSTSSPVPTEIPNNLSQKREFYDASKPKTAVRVRLLTSHVITVEVTEEWDGEDLYAEVAEQTPGMTFQLLGGFPPKKIESNGDKVLISGIGGAVVRQVRILCVCSFFMYALLDEYEI